MGLRMDLKIILRVVILGLERINDVWLLLLYIPRHDMPIVFSHELLTDTKKYL